jgi:hypothetical protein
MRNAAGRATMKSAEPNIHHKTKERPFFWAILAGSIPMRITITTNAMLVARPKRPDVMIDRLQAKPD